MSGSEAGVEAGADFGSANYGGIEVGWQGVPALQEANRRWRERRAVPEVLYAPSQGLLDDARQCLRTRPDACEHHGACRAGSGSGS